MCPSDISQEELKVVGSVLNDPTKALKERFRALFTLKNLGGKVAIDEIARCFTDPSSLLKHELAYCLGQMRDVHAIPILSSVLESDEEEVIVRHEAGEALGAISCPSVLPLLEKYCSHPVRELSETCQLAVERIRFHTSNSSSEHVSKFQSVDPAPPAEKRSVQEHRQRLLDESLPLFERYRAMFALRDVSSDEVSSNDDVTSSVLALGEGLKCTSALFRHEIAFVLGQIASPLAVDCLKTSLANGEEQPMVRHECAEALGAVATEECFDILKVHMTDRDAVVKESCDIALDMCEYENSAQFQYANAVDQK